MTTPHQTTNRLHQRLLLTQAQAMTTPHQTTNRLHQRLLLTQAQREELERQASSLGISLQQAYVRLRSGAISLDGQ